MRAADEMKSELSDTCREGRRLPADVQSLDQEKTASQTQLEGMEVRVDYVDVQGLRHHLRVCGI